MFTNIPGIAAEIINYRFHSQAPKVYYCFAFFLYFSEKANCTSLKEEENEREREKKEEKILIN